MTLFKEIAIPVSLVFLLLVVATTVSDVHRAGVFLQGQMQTTAQDMTTTLGIAISNSDKASDKATLETLFNAVFDSGYYTQIALTDMQGNVIHKKEQQITIDGVPDWFISTLSLEPARGSTRVMQGWVPLGNLSLELHPGFAYAELYRNMRDTLIMFAALLLAGLASLWLILRVVLRPLENVKQQADAIHNNRFFQQTVLPKTQELRSVVEAMNRMVSKVQQVYSEQEKTLARYQELLYIDSLTGLGNRKHMMARLELVQSESGEFDGSFAVIKLPNLESVREQRGYDKADSIIEAMAATLNDLTGKQANEDIARLSDDEFALLVPANMSATKERMHTIFERFRKQPEIVDMLDDIVLVAGLTNAHTGRDIGEILAEADFALTQAEARGSNAIVEMTSTNLTLPKGKMQWRTFLDESIKQERLYLVGQKVMDRDRAILQQEVFVRLKDQDGKVVPAGMFMPMASALGFGLDIDRAVFRMVQSLSGQALQAPVALNLTGTFFSHADAFEEFRQLLDHFRINDVGLCAESGHVVFNQYPHMCAQVAETVRAAGQTFGIDNLDLGGSLQVLQEIRPDYVKVNARTLYDMTTGDIPAGYQALRTMTDTLDIRIIAVGVDSQELYDHLAEMGIDGMQGNLLGEPVEFA